jgi:hypothetical protein
MSKIKYNQSHKDFLDIILLDNPDVKPGKMFGYPAYYVGGKLFACVYENCIGVKVPESRANELLKREEIIHFQPYGRKKMREWIQINRKNSEDYIKDREILEASIEYVSKIAGIKK